MAQASDGSFFGQSSNVYRGSLAFINHPNPVEPPSVSQRHPLDGVHQLSSTSSNQEIRRVLHDRVSTSTADERPHKRQKPTRLDSTNNVAVTNIASTSLNLPRLPVRQSAKRLRIPPTLSGLHQPPPDARILPKISTEKPAIQSTPKLLPLEKRPTPVRRSRSPNKSTTDTPLTSNGSDSRVSPAAKVKRNKWTEEETACLLKGVARFGIGNWTKILNCLDYSFTRRTAPDLKDRFRVCCPQEYNQSRDSALPRSKANQAAEQHPIGEPSGSATDGAIASTGMSSLSLEGSGVATGPKSQRKTTSELEELGIIAPFTQNTRRKRKGYTQAEDEALLKGFEEHGNAWAVIRHDEDLGLGHRKPTDLRDRFRTRYPKEYANAGLAPRPEVFPKPARRGGDSAAKTKDNERTKKPQKQMSDERPPSAHSPRKTTSTAEKDKITGVSIPPDLMPTSSASNAATIPQPTSKQNHPPLPSSFFSSYDDVFFGAPADEDGSDVGERITLDRGILDWASESSGTRLPAPAEMLRGGHADALNTFMELPRQSLVGSSTPSGSTNAGVARGDLRGGSVHRTQQQQTVTLPAISISGGGALPSLASVTAGQADDEDEQLELPSLVGFGALENDGRHFLGLDELLS